MAVGMVIQQKTSNAAMAGSMTDDQRQQQQMMMILMPIMFGFIFYKLPSGLVLYWFVNTLLTIGEQKFIFKRHRS
jgi:YidC/Oxa1 family membrane protein insertase